MLVSLTVEKYLEYLEKQKDKIKRQRMKQFAFSVMYSNPRNNQKIIMPEYLIEGLE